MLIGRQVAIEHGGSIDLIAIDQQGKMVVVELKCDKTPREVVAQALDYARWVQVLSYDDVSSSF